MTKPLKYNPAIFDVPGMDAARRVILTTSADADTDARWERETPYVADLAAEHLNPRPGQLILDYGCGIGRLSKELIERHGCRVLGVDISPSMRKLAAEYVGSDLFMAISDVEFQRYLSLGLEVDGAAAIWVIQHCLDPVQIVSDIAKTLRPNARLLVINTLVRCVPTVEKAWAKDGFDVREILRERLTEAAGGTPDPAFVGETTAPHTFWGVYGR